MKTLINTITVLWDAIIAVLYGIIGTLYGGVILGSMLFAIYVLVKFVRWAWEN